MEQWSLIQNQPILKSAINLKPLIISHKRGKSLKDMLVRSKVYNSIRLLCKAWSPKLHKGLCRPVIDHFAIS